MLVSWLLIQFDGGKLNGIGDRPENAPTNRDFVIYIGAILAISVAWFLFSNLMNSVPPTEGTGIVGYVTNLPIMGKIMWRRNYEAMLATPIQVHHILGGELLWIGFRMVLISSVFLVVLTLFKIPTSFLALLAVPACVLLGVAFSAAIISFAATQKNDAGFAAIFRFVINPLFLFSGTFFPLSSLPDSLRWVEWIAAATPLYHGVALVRGAVLGDAGTLAAWPWHAAYLVTFATVFAVVAHRLLSRRLVT
jgi:lipooligosaccharide transport system permease protein